MRADLEPRAREAGETTRRHVHAHRPTINPVIFDRELSRRRRRHRVALTAMAPLVVAAGVLLLSRQLPSSPPVIGPAPTRATPTVDDTIEVGQASEPSPSAPPDVIDELPAAPIEPRVGQSVVWTGSRMLVWGGQERFHRPGEVINDGAAYDPETRTWQRLPAAPGNGTTSHLAAWTGTQMVVVGGDGSERAVLRYDVEANTWTTGTDAPFEVHRLTSAAAWTGTRLAVWSPGLGYAEYDPERDDWTHPPPPPVDAPDDVLVNTQALHAHGDLLYAVAADVGRQVQTAVRQADGEWTRAENLGMRHGTLPGGDGIGDPQGVTDTVATDAGLLAVSREGRYIPAALLDPETGEWTDLAVPGGPSCTAYPAPLAIPRGAVIFDCGTGSHFDAQTRQFTELDLPVNPQGGSGNTVWTGRSLLTYVTGCCAGRGPAAPREMIGWEHPLNP